MLLPYLLCYFEYYNIVDTLHARINFSVLNQIYHKFKKSSNLCELLIFGFWYFYTFSLYNQCNFIFAKSYRLYIAYCLVLLYSCLMTM